MRIRNLVLPCALFCSTGLATPALAATDIMTYDANGDGVITLAEFQALQKDSFKSLDSDGNGTVIVAELQALPAAQGRNVSGKRLMARDLDGNGAVTEAEFLSQAPGFQRADRNNDGVLAGKELARVVDFLTKASF
ncbi:EF-hand domain-containing protein [Celeribacter neptunius]|uniref:EF hand n=1 Tax=Celeribacter neptunius TaxID=588602 RepID=A0A1I3WI76_9RHOB|nr:EF-hand domain-containing protein [Celeribacter neptunius]SFK06863.1 EF hand [Celeribacter neptunius]